MSKHAKLRKWLEAGKSVTGKIAMTRFGIYRLSSCILRYRRQGMRVVTKMEMKKGASFARYSVKSK